MSDFKKCITKTLRYEGVSSSSEGYVDHPNDRGGATKYGISYSFVKDTGDVEFFDMNGDMKIDKRDIQQLTFEKAVETYKKYFWDVFGLDEIERSLNECGYSLKVDGIFGPKSKRALEECAVEDFISAFQKKRASLYQAIVANNPSQSVFLSGWLNRIDWTNRDIAYV